MRVKQLVGETDGKYRTPLTPAIQRCEFEHMVHVAQ
jgi:hypothetical protein